MGFHANACQYAQASSMHMLCSACSKVTFILLHKVASKTKKNKLRNEESIGSLISTKFLDEFEIHHRTWFDHNQHNNASRTLPLKEMFNPGLTSLMVFRVTKQRLELQRRLAAQQGS
jgi:hypothetical protein